jgi:hypothetical protein
MLPGAQMLPGQDVSCINPSLLNENISSTEDESRFRRQAILRCPDHSIVKDAAFSLDIKIDKS